MLFFFFTLSVRTLFTSSENKNPHFISSILFFLVAGTFEMVVSQIHGPFTQLHERNDFFLKYLCFLQFYPAVLSHLVIASHFDSRRYGEMELFSKRFTLVLARNLALRCECVLLSHFAVVTPSALSHWHWIMTPECDICNWIHEFVFVFSFLLIIFQIFKNNTNTMILIIYENSAHKLLLIYVFNDWTRFTL